VWSRFNETVRATERLKNGRLWLVFVLISGLLLLSRVLAWSVAAVKMTLSAAVLLVLAILVFGVFWTTGKVIEK
jgi:hypothetical protein